MKYSVAIFVLTFSLNEAMFHCLLAEPNANEIDAREKGKTIVDFLYVLEMYAILLEDDENMHMSYNLDCEVTRLHEIADHVKKPLHVIRFNPHRSNFTELSEALTEAFKTNHPYVFKLKFTKPISHSLNLNKFKFKNKPHIIF